MEKNRIHTQAYGNRIRMSYAKEREVLEMPNLLDVQKDSYNWFVNEGLREVFEDINPIVDYGGHLTLEFIDFNLKGSRSIPFRKLKSVTPHIPRLLRSRSALPTMRPKRYRNMRCSWASSR